MNNIFKKIFNINFKEKNKNNKCKFYKICSLYNPTNDICRKYSGGLKENGTVFCKKYNQLELKR